MADKTLADQLRCGACGALGQWINDRTEKRYRPRTEPKRFKDDPDLLATEYLELECSACGAYTYANPRRVSHR